MKTGKIIGPAFLLALMVFPLLAYAKPLTKDYLRAVDQAGQGRFSEAKKTFQELAAAESPHERAGRCLQIIADLETQKVGAAAAAHLFKGLSFFYKGRFSEAIAEADLAVKLNPGYARAYSSRGAS